MDGAQKLLLFLPWKVGGDEERMETWPLPRAGCCVPAPELLPSTAEPLAIPRACPP